ncbi:MAG: carbohydrate binding domain-containing protein [Dehalococcoidia bacterium]
MRGLVATQEELLNIQTLLRSYASPKQRRQLPWPVENHPAWDAVDELHAEVLWVREMLFEFVENEQIIPPRISERQHPCLGLMESFPDAWWCPAAFGFSGDGSVFQFDLDNEGCARTGEFGNRVSYSNSGPAFSGWGIQWDGSPDQHFNGFLFTKLTFWVKGDAGGETFQVGLKDTSGKEVKVESTSYVAVTTDWRQVTIPLVDFSGVNKGSIANWNLGFNNTHGHGVICVDDGKFE